MRCYAFVIASMYRYSWLITFKIFRNFFWIEGWVGGVYSIQTFLDFIIFFIFTRPLRCDRTLMQNESQLMSFCFQDDFHHYLYRRRHHENVIAWIYFTFVLLLAGRVELARFCCRSVSVSTNTDHCYRNVRQGSIVTCLKRRTRV